MESMGQYRKASVLKACDYNNFHFKIISNFHPSNSKLEHVHRL